MTQKEIATAKRKAKECLEVYNMNVPMTKMNILFYYFDKEGGFFITFLDVRTNDYYACDCVNNEYSLTKTVKDTDKTYIFTSNKGGKTID